MTTEAMESQEIMQPFTFGKEKVNAVFLDRVTVHIMADKLGKNVSYRYKMGRYFALPSAVPDEEATNFYVNGWYVERDGREPRWMTDEEFQAAKG